MGGVLSKLTRAELDVPAGVHYEPDQKIEKASLTFSIK